MTFACQDYNKKLSTYYTLKRHYKAIYSKEVERQDGLRKSPSVTCGQCSSTFKVRDFNAHLESKHQIVLDYEEKAFGDLDEFNKWKKSVEKEQTSYFVKKRGSKKLSDGNTRAYFGCNRGGIYKGPLVDF